MYTLLTAFHSILWTGWWWSVSVPSSRWSC